jgi:hypothetical protein
MSHKMFQQQWVLDPVCAIDVTQDVKNAVAYLMRNMGNQGALKMTLTDLYAFFAPEDEDDASPEEWAEGIALYPHHKVVYDYIKKVNPELGEREYFLIYHWW